MASSHGIGHSEPAVMEQIISEFFAKSLHIILDSRCPSVSSRNYSGDHGPSSPSPPSSSSSSPSFRSRDKLIKDRSAALESLELCRQNVHDPMIVDVILVQRPTDWDPLNFYPNKSLARNSSGKDRGYYSSDNDEFGYNSKNEKIIERWILQYESRKNVGRASGSKRSGSTSTQTLYKKYILLLRSLYTTVRLLPAYELFRDLISSAKIRLYNLHHRISSFVEPFTRKEEADMQRFTFTPIDTSCGMLCLSVLYCSSLMEPSSEPSTPISPQFISEYVGSPMAEPLKRFSSGPVPKSAPSSFPFGRRHSWSYDLYKASPPSANPSPSPTYSEPYALMLKRRSSQLPPSGLPRPTNDETPALHVKNPSYDEYWHSPMPSPSTSPSPPPNNPATHAAKALFRCESAPVGIPASRISGAPSLPDNQLLPPSPPVKADKLVVYRQTELSGLRQTKTAANKVQMFSIGNYESGSEVKPSTSSPARMLLGTSGRLSFQEDYDDFGPFVVDEDDIMHPVSRLGHLCGPQKKSQDARVGALILMLNKAPPLHADTSVASQYLQGSRPEPEFSSNCTYSEAGTASRTIADALEELRSYKEMKRLLLLQQSSADLLCGPP